MPVFSFGETDVYDQVNVPVGSLFRKFQEFVKKLTGVVPAIPLGRGLFQNSFGVLPFKKPINVDGEYSYRFFFNLTLCKIINI